MNHSPKTPVEITQELLALVTAKIEKEGDPGNSGSARIVGALRDELSLYGDNIGSTVDRTDLYFDADKHDENAFKEAVKRIRANAGEVPENLEKIFQQLLA